MRLLHIQALNVGVTNTKHRRVGAAEAEAGAGAAGVTGRLASAAGVAWSGGAGLAVVALPAGVPSPSVPEETLMMSGVPTAPAETLGGAGAVTVGAGASAGVAVGSDAAGGFPAAGAVARAPAGEDALLPLLRVADRVRLAGTVGMAEKRERKMVTEERKKRERG